MVVVLGLWPPTRTFMGLFIKRFRYALAITGLLAVLRRVAVTIPGAQVVRIAMKRAVSWLRQIRT